MLKLVRRNQTMKHLALAITLACLLSGAALAGEIPSTGVPTPTSTSSGATQGPGLATTIVLTIVSLISR